MMSKEGIRITEVHSSGSCLTSRWRNSACRIFWIAPVGLVGRGDSIDANIVSSLVDQNNRSTYGTKAPETITNVYQIVSKGPERLGFWGCTRTPCASGITENVTTL